MTIVNAGFSTLSCFEPGHGATLPIPDVDAFNINRVEVLRGRQGSLTGSASPGGAANYIANVADTKKWDAAAMFATR